MKTIDQTVVGDGPYYLDQAGETYVLTEDIITTGTALVISAEDVTLDLQGHKIVFGLSGEAYRYGIAVPPHYDHAARQWQMSDITRWHHNDRPQIINGTVEQYHSGGAYCAAVSAWYADDVAISKVEVAIFGDDTTAFLLNQNRNLTVTACKIDDQTTVVSNRHQGRAAIDVKFNKGNLKISGNTIVGAAQWGIRVTRQTKPDQPLEWGEVSNNLIGCEAVRVNAYGLGIHGDKLKVFSNVINSERGYGAHIGEGADSTQFYGNTISIKCAPIWEQYDRINAHGLAIERPTNSNVYGNYIISTGSWPDEKANGVGCALKIGCTPGGNNWIHNNIFEARYEGGAADRLGTLHGTTAILIDEYGPADTRIEENHFITEDRFINMIEVFDGTPANRLPRDLSVFVLRNNTWTRQHCAVPVQGWDILFGGSSVYNLTLKNPAGCDFRNSHLGWKHLPCKWSVLHPDGSGYTAHFEGEPPGIREFLDVPIEPEPGKVAVYLDGESVDARQVEIRIDLDGG